VSPTARYLDPRHTSHFQGLPKSELLTCLGEPSGRMTYVWPKARDSDLHSLALATVPVPDGAKVEEWSYDLDTGVLVLFFLRDSDAVSATMFEERGR
jgi:hypothetical protein